MVLVALPFRYRYKIRFIGRRYLAAGGTTYRSVYYESIDLWCRYIHRRPVQGLIFAGGMIRAGPV